MPPLAAVGVPEMVAVPLPWLAKLTPGGQGPVWVTVVAYVVGLPTVVTVKLNAVPAVAVAVAALVKVGTATWSRPP